MRDDLMAEQIEVDPSIAATPLRTAQDRPIESSRGVEIVNGEGNMEWRKRVHDGCSVFGVDSEVDGLIAALKQLQLNELGTPLKRSRYRSHDLHPTGQPPMRPEPTNWLFTVTKKRLAK